MTNENGKMAAGKMAASLVQDGMLVGLGTGSTAAYFIDFLISRCHNENLKIKAIATSIRSANQAKAGRIELLDPSTLTTLDLNVDGADEIDEQFRMIKGGGGALLREKIVASSSVKKVTVVDAAKVVDRLGKFPLPLEVLKFGFASTLSRIEKLGYDGRLRKNSDGSIYVTDNGNYIIDIHFREKRVDPQADEISLKSIPGVLETGFFFNLVDEVIIGSDDGSARLWTKEQKTMDERNRNGRLRPRDGQKEWTEGMDKTIWT